ncbi:hypothetical protein NHH03_26125 [Stieleria sp. TO1_6]|uniref:hypothetical protein n=1 Tax=Stieleria tagensis TaxID=2956795 RepID=UPI00209AFF91|nr:hypothetical protein [Stieleria tagensis]MCO8125242.1 hypothetical protein [Stieleria tagensis]
MAYHFSAEKTGEQDLQTLQERLSKFNLIEFFPVEVSDESLTLGVSIPFKVMDDPRFENEVEKAMSYLVSEQGFQVTDLFTGNGIASSDISKLASQISA